DETFSAAYEGVTYRDSTDDDNEGAIAEGAPFQGDFPLEQERPRLEKRLAFLSLVARLWQIAVQSRRELAPEFEAWLGTARANYSQLLELLDAIHALAVPEAVGAFDALVEHDRRQTVKEHLLNRT